MGKGRGLKRNVTEALELPKEVILNLPLVSLIGREELCIENYKGVIEYSEERIRVNTGVGVLKIEGKNLFLRHITSESITITGGITKFEFVV